MLNKAFGIMSKPLQHVRVTAKGGVIGDLRQDTGEMLDCPEMASPPLICLMFPMGLELLPAALWHHPQTKP